MEKSEIEELKAIVAEETKIQIDPNEDEAIAVMAESVGWKLLMKKINSRICEFLEPVNKKDVSSDTNLELIGAMALARSARIEELRWMSSQVESVRKAKRLMEKQKEESETETQ